MSSINPYPHELQFGDIYITPVLVVVVVAFFATVVTAWMLNRFKVAHYFIFPHYIFLAIMVLYVLLIDKYWIHF